MFVKCIYLSTLWGRLARLTVALEETLITVITHNVAAFSVETTETAVQGNELLLDGHFIHPAQNAEGGLFFVKQRGRWTVSCTFRKISAQS